MKLIMYIVDTIVHNPCLMAIDSGNATRNRWS